MIRIDLELIDTIQDQYDVKTKNGFVPVADEKFWNEVFIEHAALGMF